MNMFTPFISRPRGQWMARCTPLAAAGLMLAVTIPFGAKRSGIAVAAEDASASPAPATESAADAPAAVDRFVAPHPALASAPRRTQTGRGHAGDPINVAFVGSDRELHHALARGGW
jgi:hypothetical protein